jgi:site-specific recombinase XerD
MLEMRQLPGRCTLFWENVMTPLRQRFVDDLRVRNYAARTIEAYVAGVVRFTRHFGRSPELLGTEEIRTFQLHLLERKVSWSQFNQTVCALRFLYGKTLGRPEQVPLIPYGKRPHTLPCVLSPEEVARLIEAATPGRDRLLLQTAYACGLRLGELVHLRVTDIDSARMVVNVRQGKGRKDRQVPLSLHLLAELRAYWRCYRPARFLFANRSGQGTLCPNTVQRMFQRVRRLAGIHKPASMHTLRHSFATHMLEEGVDVVTLQRLLGHADLSTTARYLHLRSERLQQLPNLLDVLTRAARPPQAILRSLAEGDARPAPHSSASAASPPQPVAPSTPRQAEGQR